MNRFKIGIIILTLISSSCFSQTKKGENDIPFYFPTEKNSDLDNNVKLDSFLNTWYSEQLYALKEPILFSGQVSGKSVYRITVLRTFANPYTMRIENINDTITLYWKECDGSGGYEPGILIKDKKITLTIENWKTIEKYIAEIDFWNLPTLDETVDSPPDGTTGIIEGKKGSQYNMITHWNPEKVDVSNMFNFLVNLTDIDFKKQRD